MPRSGISPVLPALLAPLLLAGCGQDSVPDRPQDPAIAAALADPLMTDMDLASQNRSEDALSGIGLPDGSLPPLDHEPSDISAARDEALRLAGGALKQAPRIEAAQSARIAASTPAQLAARAGFAGGACGGALQYGAIWAARLPAGLDIYPRGHVIDAAGADRQGCALRVVRYVSPVPVADIADFHFTRLEGASVRGEGGRVVLSGKRPGFAYAIRISRRADKASEVELVSRAQ